MKAFVLIGLVYIVAIAGCEKSKTIDIPEQSKAPAPTATMPVKQEYDQNSWRSIIPQDCMAFFDGCNNCRRMIDLDEVACTKKFCAEYQRPFCRDSESSPAPASQGASAESATNKARVVEYHCNEGMFKVHYNEYVQDDQRMKLKDNQVMFADAQTHTVSLLVRDDAASGTKFSNDSIAFWSKGSDAMVSINDARTYNNCKQVEVN